MVVDKSGRTRRAPDGFRHDGPLGVHLHRRNFFSPPAFAGLSNRPCGNSGVKTPATASVFFFFAPNCPRMAPRPISPSNGSGRHYGSGVLQRIARPHDVHPQTLWRQKLFFVVGGRATTGGFSTSPQRKLPELGNKLSSQTSNRTFPTECLRYETLIAGASAADISSLYRIRASQVSFPAKLASLILTLFRPPPASPRA